VRSFLMRPWPRVRFEMPFEPWFMPALSTIVYGTADEFPEFDTVYADHAAGTSMLVRWLAEQGCQKILRVWHGPTAEMDRPWFRKRNIGYDHAMTELGLEALKAAYIPHFERVAPETSTPAIRPSARPRDIWWKYCGENGPVDAIVALSDGEAMLLTAALQVLDRQIPVVGYDNYWSVNPYINKLATPPAATH